MPTQLAATFSSFFPYNPIWSTKAPVTLAGEGEPLAGAESMRCELRIEGMTCGACVEVCCLIYQSEGFQLSEMTVHRVDVTGPAWHSIR